MSVTHGMNTQEVEALGQLLRTKGDRLRDLAVEVDRIVYSTTWDGDDGARFTRDWPTYKARLFSSAELLRGLGQSAMNNASEQLRASSMVGGGGGGGGGLPRNHVALPALLGATINGGVLSSWYRKLADWEAQGRVPPAMLREFPELEWAIRDGREQLSGMLTASSAEQGVWWSGLSDEQQRALLVAYPGLLAGMAGLPAAVRAAANEQYALSMRGEVAQRVDAETAAAQVNTGVWKFGAEASATTTQYVDGRVEVTLRLEGDLGRDVGGAGVGVEGGVEVTYSFVNAEQAQEFLAGLKDRLDPNAFESMAGDDAAAFIRMHDGFRESTTVSLAAEGSAEIKIGNLEASLSGSAGGTYNLDTGGKTLFVEVSAGASGVGLSGDVSGQLQLHLDANNQVSGATLSGSIGAAGGADMAAILTDMSGGRLGGVDASALVGGEASFSASIDPSDPRIQQQLQQLVENPGDPVAIREILRLSEAQISINTTSSTSSSVEVLGTGVETSSSSSESVATYVKSPGGTWVVVR